MVLKRGKHGLNTGCSVKLAHYSRGSPLGRHAVLNKEYNRRTSTHEFVDTSHSIDSFVDDGNITACNEMFYSLNKHGRWRLLEVLAEAVDDIHSVVEEQSCPRSKLCRLIVSDRQLFPKEDLYGVQPDPADCKRYHDSGAAHSHVYPRKRFSGAFDLKRKANTAEQQNQAKQKRKTRNPRHNQHSRGVQRKAELHGKRRKEEGGNREEQQPEAWMEECEYIFYGQEELTAHPRFADRTYKPGRYSTVTDLRPRKMRPNVNKMSEHFPGSYTWKDFMQPSLMDPWSDMEASEDEEDMVTDNAPTRTCIIDLTEAVMKSKQQKNLRKKKTTVTKEASVNYTVWSANTASICVKIHGKGTAIYEPQEESSSENDDESVDSDVSVASSSQIPVSLSSDWLPSTPTTFISRVKGPSLHRESLVVNFGEAHKEGQSLPRRFSVDLSRLIARSTDGTSGVGGEVPVPDVVLVFCPGGVINGCQDSLYAASRHVRVQLESDLPTKQSLFDHLQGAFGCVSKGHSVDDIVQEAVQYLTSVYIRQVEMGNRHVTDVSDTQDRLDKDLVSYVNSLRGCRVQVYSPDCRQLTDKFLDPATNESQQSRTETRVDVAWDYSGLFCNICFSYIDNAAYGIPQGTALLPCQHWFCNECWWHHLVERIRHGDLSIACPGHDCGTRLDRVTLLSLTSLNIYTKHRQHIASATVDHSHNWQWCPRAKCGRLAHITAASVNSPVLDVGVDCTCGATWCFQCQQVVHWPATCSHMGSYMKLMKERWRGRYNDSGHTYFAKVKKCPQCHQPMEKSGGCQHMACRCGASFCWECLCLWQDHGPYLVCPRSHVSITVLELDNANELATNERHMRHAMRHHDASTLKNYSLTVRRIKAVLTRQQIIIQNNRTRSHRQATMSLSLHQVNANLLSLNTFNTFIGQMHKFLECTYVLLASCDRKTRNQSLEKKVSLLEFLLSRMGKLLGEVRMGNVSKIFAQLHMLMSEQKKLLQRAAPDMRRTQKAVAKKTS